MELSEIHERIALLLIKTRSKQTVTQLLEINHNELQRHLADMRSLMNCPNNSILIQRLRQHLNRPEMSVVEACRAKPRRWCDV